jgi:hypothetical protein
LAGDFTLVELPALCLALEFGAEVAHTVAYVDGRWFIVCRQEELADLFVAACVALYATAKELQQKSAPRGNWIGAGLLGGTSLRDGLLKNRGRVGGADSYCVGGGLIMRRSQQQKCVNGFPVEILCLVTVAKMSNVRVGARWCAWGFARCPGS